MGFLRTTDGLFGSTGAAPVPGCQHGATFHGCTPDGAYVVGDPTVLAFFARWVPDAAPGNQLRHVGRRQDWSECLADELAHMGT